MRRQGQWNELGSWPPPPPAASAEASIEHWTRLEEDAQAEIARLRSLRAADNAMHSGQTLGAQQAWATSTVPLPPPMNANARGSRAPPPTDRGTASAGMEHADTSARYADIEQVRLAARGPTPASQEVAAVQERIATATEDWATMTQARLEAERTRGDDAIAAFHRSQTEVVAHRQRAESLAEALRETQQKLRAAEERATQATAAFFQTENQLKEAEEWAAGATAELVHRLPRQTSQGILEQLATNKSRRKWFVQKRPPGYISPGARRPDPLAQGRHHPGVGFAPQPQPQMQPAEFEQQQQPEPPLPRSNHGGDVHACGFAAPTVARSPNEAAGNAVGGAATPDLSNPHDFPPPTPLSSSVGGPPEDFKEEVARVKQQLESHGLRAQPEPADSGPGSPATPERDGGACILS